MNEIQEKKGIIKKRTKSHRFVDERKTYWNNLESIIRKIRKKGYKSLTEEEAGAFPHLYRRICSDSELARTLSLSPDTLEYIDNLLQHAHDIFYSSPKIKLRHLWDFFNKDFPKAFMKNWIPLLTIILLFFGIAVISFLCIYNNPEWAARILPEDLIKQMKSSYSTSISEKRDTNMNLIMSAFYIRNNISIAFFSFALGVTLGLGTLYIIINNAITIGAVLAVVAAAGYGNNIFSFVIAHSVFELLGICIAGGAGLALGLAVIQTGVKKKGVHLKEKAREIVPLVLVAAFFIAMAAFIEGLISPLELPIFVKILIAIISLFIIGFYASKFIVKRFLFLSQFHKGDKHGRT